MKALKLNEACLERPHAGKTCARIEFAEKEGWGGIVWQSPANDWGDRPGGFDLSGAKRLSFWARGERGGETVTFEFGLLGADKAFPDTAKGKLDKVRLTAEWKEHAIDLAGKDLTRIKTGFACIVAGGPVIIYIDDVQFE